jgi:FAD-dependent oxidoreductase family protein
MKRFSLSITLFALLIVPIASLASAKTIQESARAIPVAYDVDVVVVGGSAAGVAAAVEAAQNGASVFLAAPRPYLGEDLCAPYRLWLEPGEEPSTPFTQKLFAEPLSEILPERGLSFTYQTDQPSDAKHKDTATPSLLNDGKFSNSSSQSVQYNNDVVITVDLGGERNVQKTHVMA